MKKDYLINNKRKIELLIALLFLTVLGLIIGGGNHALVLWIMSTITGMKTAKILLILILAVGIPMLILLVYIYRKFKQLCETSKL